ncbi:MAG: DsbA family oxidoreductase [Solirubrobacteraceae bacterium]|nr:DsbA family oxidoreductase [Solirubrobacteraceae bacterium]
MSLGAQHQRDVEPLLDVQLWSDVVCPWCWIGEARLRLALRETGLLEATRVTVRSYQLDPSAKRGPVIEMLAEKYGKSLAQAREMTEQVADLGEELDLPMDFDIAVSANTADAHQLIHLARRTGHDLELTQRLHRAHFAEGADVSDHTVLTHCAGDVGLDEHEAEMVLRTGAFAQDVVADREEALRIGVRGVPFFVLGRRFAVSGAQPVEAMVMAIEKATQPVA